MRILKRILFILMVITLIINVSFNVIFLVSYTKFMDLSEENHWHNSVITADERLAMYYASSDALTNSEHFTLRSENVYNQTSTAVDLLSCDLIENAYQCKMISKLYDSDKNLVRTSYFPGDNYKYSVEGETKTKTAYVNTALQSYFESFRYGVTYYLYYVVYDLDSETPEYVTYQTNLHTNKGVLELEKEIIVNYDDGNGAAVIEYLFNGSNQIINLSFNNSSIMSISYEQTDLEFPEFNSDYISQ